MTKLGYFFKKNKNEDADDAEYRSKLLRHKIFKVQKRVVVFVLILVLIIGAKVYYDTRTYTGYSVTESIMEGDTSKSRFYEYGDYILRYSDDGIAYLKGAETIWNQAFEMKEPIIDICNENVAIAELRTNDVYIFDYDGLVSKVKTAYPILALEVSNNGVVAAVTEEEENNHIEILDKDGNTVAIGQTVLSGDGCPMDISLSEDGSKLMVSYLYVNGGAVQTKVVFYNYSEVGKNEVDRIVGGFNQYKSTVVPDVEFISNDIAVAFGDDMFTVYSIKQKPSILKESAHDKKVRSVFYGGGYFGFVFDNEVSGNPIRVCIYDGSGKVVYDKEIDFEFTKISVANDTVVMHDSERLLIQTIKGRVKYDDVVKEGINQVLNIGASTRFVLVTSESVKEIKLK